MSQSLSCAKETRLGTIEAAGYVVTPHGVMLLIGAVIYSFDPDEIEPLIDTI